MNYPVYGPAISQDTLYEQREWSLRNFGPGARTNGILNHIEKELDEIRAKPYDLEEWIDVMILAADGAWRTGATSQQVLQAYNDKLRKNFARTWPNWKDFSQDQAIEHVQLCNSFAIGGEDDNYAEHYCNRLEHSDDIECNDATHRWFSGRHPKVYKL